MFLLLFLLVLLNSNYKLKQFYTSNTVEVSKEFKIGLTRLYKIWSKTPYNATTSGSVNAYKTARQLQLQRQRKLAEEISALRTENVHAEVELAQLRDLKEILKREYTEEKKIYSKLSADKEKLKKNYKYTNK